MEEQQIKTPIERLIDFYIKELFNEVVYNKDSTSFWEKANDYIFSSALTSFRESVKSLIEGMNEDKDMFNYFSALCFRIFSQPYTKEALKEFCQGFDEAARDPILSEGYSYTTSQLTVVQQLLLFFCVHRNEITIAMDQKSQDIINQQKVPRGKQ